MLHFFQIFCEHCRFPPYCFKEFLMSQITTDICRAFEELGCPYQKIKHAASHTSEQSAQARVAGGGPLVIGAKALLLKATVRGDAQFHLFVLPGPSRLASSVLNEHFPDWKRSRFANAAELAERARGVLPGAVPPFGKPIFPLIDRLHFDSELVEINELIGFNAGDHCVSLIVQVRDLIDVAKPDDVFRFSDPVE